MRQRIHRRRNKKPAEAGRETHSAGGYCRSCLSVRATAASQIVFDMARVAAVFVLAAPAMLTPDPSCTELVPLVQLDTQTNCVLVIAFGPPVYSGADLNEPFPATAFTSIQVCCSEPGCS